MAQQGWEQLSPNVTFAGEDGREETLHSPCGVSLWPQAQAGYPQSSVLLPVLVNEHGAPRPSGRGTQSFPLSCLILLQQPVPRSCGAASHLWERLWKSHCCSCLEWWSGEGSHTAPWIFITKTKALVLCPSPFLCTSNPYTINKKVTKRRADRETD